MRVSPLRKFVAVHTFHTGVPKMRHGPQNKSRKMGIGWVRKITWKTQEKNKNQGNKKNTLLSFWVNYVLQGFRASKLFTETSRGQNGASSPGVRDIYNPLWPAALLTCPKFDGLRIDQCHTVYCCAPMSFLHNEFSKAQSVRLSVCH